jgi:hypothetical protein
MASVGKKSFLLEVVSVSGKPMLSIVCERTAFQRRDGSLYVVSGGRRQTLTQHPNGNLSLRQQQTQAESDETFRRTGLRF